MDPGRSKKCIMFTGGLAFDCKATLLLSGSANNLCSCSRFCSTNITGHIRIINTTVVATVDATVAAKIADVSP